MCIHVVYMCMFCVCVQWGTDAPGTNRKELYPKQKSGNPFLCHLLWSKLHTYHKAQGHSHTTYVHTSGETKKVYRLTKSCQLAFLHFILCWLCQWLSNIKIVHLYYFFLIYPCLLLWNQEGIIWEARKSRKVRRWDGKGKKKYLRQKTGNGAKEMLVGKHCLHVPRRRVTLSPPRNSEQLPECTWR